MTKLVNHSNYNCIIETETGEKFKVYADWLHNQHLDHWQDWECHAGSERLFIDKDLEVYSGECKNNYLGNSKHPIKLLDGTKCKQNRCSGCTDDLAVRKYNQQEKK